MRVGIDATALLVPVKTGIQHYTTSLILSMVDSVPEYPDLELFLYFHARDRDADASLLSSYASKLGRTRIRHWRFPRGYRSALALMAAVDQLDLLHLPKPSSLRFCPCPILVTIHDLCWAKLPLELIIGERTADMAEAEKIIKKASALIAVSRNTRDDLVAEYQVLPERVWVVHNGIDSLYRPAPDAAEDVRRKYDLGHYILCVSTLQRRKNLVRLVEAYARLVAGNTIPHNLVLVGAKGWGHEEVYEAVDRLNLLDRVIFPNYVPQKELPGLYTGTDLLIYPSLYEGFGLPVLEAMACGAPVAVARSSSLPEVAGEAGVYFDPYSVDDIAEKISQVLGDDNLNMDLRLRGPSQARKFNWQKTARETLAAYQGLATGDIARSPAQA